MDNYVANQLGAKGALLAELAILDLRSARPLRAVLTAQAAGQQPAPADLQALTALESQAASLRAQLAS